MDVDPPKRWNKWKLDLLWAIPLEPRKKIKKFMKLGDDYYDQGDLQCAEYCYALSRGLASQAGAVHLQKKLNKGSKNPSRLS